MATVRKRTWTNADGKTTVKWMVDYKDQFGKRRFINFDKKKDAEARLVDVQGEIKQGIHTPVSTSITVAEAADIWLERGKLEELERSTLNEYRRHADRFIKPALGVQKLARLTTPGIVGFRDDLIRHGTSRAMARKVLTSLKGVIAEAHRRGLVAQNVALPVTVDIKGRDKTKLGVGRDIPSKAEINSILVAAEGRWRPFLITAIFTGMRASELRGLTWDDVDFDAKLIHVRQRANLWGETGAPKSHAGQRSIPVISRVVNALREWKAACPPGQLVFPNGKGKVESHANILNRGFWPLQVKLGMVNADDGKAKYSLHALRHFYASWAIEQGFTPKKLQSLLGHSSIQMTFDVYGHLFPSLEDDHAKLEAGAKDFAAIS